MADRLELRQRRPTKPFAALFLETAPRDRRRDSEFVRKARLGIRAYIADLFFARKEAGARSRPPDLSLESAARPEGRADDTQTSIDLIFT